MSGVDPYTARNGPELAEWVNQATNEGLPVFVTCPVTDELKLAFQPWQVKHLLFVLHPDRRVRAAFAIGVACHAVNALRLMGEEGDDE